MGRLDPLYARLPVPAQHAAVSAYGAYWYWQRFGPGYRRDLDAMRARERWSADRWHDWQQRRLRSLLADAAERVPFYRDTWGPAERQAAAAGALADLPLLEKQPLRADPTQFLDPGHAPRRPLVFGTSGSTGTPIMSYWTVGELRESMAVREVRSANWAGVSFRQPRATMSGRISVPDPDSPGPFHRFNVVERQIYLSPFHVSVKNAPVYAQAFRAHHIRWATGYAVGYGLLARAMLEAGVEPLDLDAVITTSEKLTDDLRDVISRAFGCRVYEEYSSVENALFAGECPRGRLHVSPDIGIVEILRPDGTPCDPGETGEVVATPLFRRYQPFVRYRIGDAASWSDEPCPCGRAMPVIAEVAGRLEDVVIAPDGHELVRFHGVWIGLPHVMEGQVVQETRLDYLLKVVVTDAYDADDEQELIARMLQRLGPTAKVRVETVPEIPRDKSGKYRAVVSLVPREERLGLDAGGTHTPDGA